MPTPLKAFWRYYGGKNRAAKIYPEPKFDTIVEPFAGAAGYACRYHDRAVYLFDCYPVVAGIWKYLIRVSEAEILRIPLDVQHIDELPSWVPQEARHLIGFWLNAGTTAPRKQLSSGRKKQAATGRRFEGWTSYTAERVASQLRYIRHWRVGEMSYADIPADTRDCTWFVDPPYNNKAGGYYVHSDVDYNHLAGWCEDRQGQVIVCENAGASWLPFKTLATIQAGPAHKVSAEVIWTQG